LAGLLSRESRARIRSGAPIGIRASCLLAVVTGILWFLAFAGPDLWPCSFVALVPLIVALDTQSSRRCIGIGALAGFTQNALSFYWIDPTLRSFTHLPAVSCAVLTAVLCAYQSGKMGLFAWLYGRGQDRSWPVGPIFFAAFVASERAYPELFPFHFGDCVHQVPCLIQVAELGGPYAVSLVLASPNLALAQVALGLLGGRRVRWTWVAMGVAVPLLASVGGILRLRTIDAEVAVSPPVRVGLVQANIKTEPSAFGDLASMERHFVMSSELRARGVDFVVWSEAAVNALPEETYREAVSRLFARRLRLPAIAGAILVRRLKGVKHVFNVAIETSSDGGVVGRYDKELLFPFGEHLPLGDAFPILRKWLPYTDELTPGTEADSMTVGGHEIAAVICYEDMFPAFVSGRVAKNHGEMLITLTNDSWFGATSEPWGHLAVAQMRAVEHRLYSLRAAVSGVSGVIDPGGRLVAHTGVFDEEVIDAPVHWMKHGRTGYEVWGDAPWWGAAVLSVVFAFIRRRSGRKGVFR
jgi:apolipoprotein N-acyltransferase